eukprot:CAMPEP_0194337434 /NCGR_PEP_ID=MMETSP0171-20130528/76277_1 /TAXON_ID=218684 /ORGANISM="Corethron pennatum, Strain L29A3" /LENGTH=218 /DNA_ID=CAMNT_0039101215 /DNA_START=356 /DNA_END=1010 /DNA_ORIENTATION=+
MNTVQTLLLFCSAAQMLGGFDRRSYKSVDRQHSASSNIVISSPARGRASGCVLPVFEPAVEAGVHDRAHIAPLVRTPALDGPPQELHVPGLRGGAARVPTPGASPLPQPPQDSQLAAFGRGVARQVVEGAAPPPQPLQDADPSAGGGGGARNPVAHARPYDQFRPSRPRPEARRDLFAAAPKGCLVQADPERRHGGEAVRGGLALAGGHPEGASLKFV